MSDKHSYQVSDFQRDVQHVAEDASHLGGQIYNDLRTEGKKIADYVGKTPAVADVAGALVSLAIVTAPEAPPVAIGLGTLGVTMFGAKAVYDLAKPAIDEAGKQVVNFPTLRY